MPTITGVTKHFPRVAENTVAMSLGSSISAGATTVPVNGMSNYADGDVVVFMVDPTLGIKQVFTGTKSGTNVTGVKWTYGANVGHSSGATVIDYVSSTAIDMISAGIQVHANQDGSLKDNINPVASYSADSTGSADASAAFQSAITAAIAAGGGTIFIPPGTYKIVTTLSIDPSTLTNPLQIVGYGAKLSYTGASDCIVILTNIAGSDVQHAERSVHLEGLHIVGTGSASSAIHNKATFTTMRNLIIEDFTAITSQKAAIIMDASFHFWVEECHLENIEIKNTGNGICFISQDDSGGSSASAANNSFTNIHMWLTQAGGTGVYGVGLGATTLVQVARSVFSNMIVHMVNVANLTAFDLRKCYVEGTVFLAPGVDVSGTATSSVGWSYTFTNVLTVLGPTFFPLSSVGTKFTGGGAYFITGGNVPSTLKADSTGQVSLPSFNITNNINDINGNEYFTLASTASAINNIRVSNSAAANWPTISGYGDDTHVGMYLYPKGSSGQVILADHNVNEVLKMGLGTASAINEVTITNAAINNAPRIASSGDDTNIDVQLDGKGSGKVVLGTTSTGDVQSVRKLNVMSATATPAGGTAGAGLQFGTTSNFGIFFGSNTPSLSAAKGSLYLRTDGTSGTTRMYINTDGSTTWTAVNTVA